MSKPRVLLVDDDRQIRDLLREYLTGRGMQVETASSGEDGVDRAKAFQPQVVVLDVMLPGIDGLETCRRLRAISDAPIIMLSAAAELPDKVLGLEAGAIDYVTKPFEPAELLARLKAHLRREEARQAAAGRVETGALVVDLAAGRALRAGAPVELTKTEFALLALLAKHAGKNLSRDFLLESVWGYDSDCDTRTLDSFVYRLREKLEPDPHKPTYLKTAHGTGYRLEILPPAP